MLAPTWNKEIKFPDESYSVSDFQDDFEYIFKKISINPSMRIYIKK